MMENKEHITWEGFREIVPRRCSLNKGLSDNIKQEYPDIVPVPRPMVQPSKIFNSH